MVMRGIVLVLAASALLIAGCGGSSKPAASPTGAPPVATTTLAPMASDVAGQTPKPRHVTFAPGETISADGQARIVFLDPKTGAAEGWEVPAGTFPDIGPVPFSFTVGGFSADGRKIVYTYRIRRGPPR